MFTKIETPKKQQLDTVDREAVIQALKQFRGQWKDATGGKMRKATVNLEYLFDDLVQLVRKL